MTLLKVLSVALMLLATPLTSFAQQRTTPYDTISVERLLALWEAEVSVPPRYQSPKTGALMRILRSPSDHRAQGVLEGLEAIAIGSTIQSVQLSAVIAMTSGYRDGRPSGLIAGRMENLYHTTTDEGLRRAVLAALTSIEGGGRQSALTWLEDIITSDTENLAFPAEGAEAVSTAARLGPAGRALVRRLLQAGTIVDESTRQRARLVT
jgi:hypothetical protein